MEELLQAVGPLLAAIERAGGAPLIVGGAVRDALLGRAAEDIDIEVHGLSPAALIALAGQLGRAEVVGRAFGVLRLRLPGGRAVDIALPQRRSQAGERGALLEPDADMTPREAAARRDFTWNALALTPDGQLLDFFGGQRDLRQRVIRHTSPAFDEDPLRVLRAVQLAARFDLHLAPETAARCRALLPQAPGLPPERVWGEWHKWAALGQRPSAGLRALRDAGWLAHYPELQALEGCPQDPIWHPEGDVWVHTLHVCDAAAAVAARDRLGGAARAELLLAALCHDLGKPLTTAPGHDGRMRSPGHAAVGVPLARALLARLGAPRSYHEVVAPLVQEHMSHVNLEPTDRSVRRLAVRLGAATISAWRRLVEADMSGRPPLPPADPGAPIAALADALGAGDGRPEPIVRGRDLIAHGHPAGPQLGELLRRVYAAQIEGEFDDLAGGLAWARAAGER